MLDDFIDSVIYQLWFLRSLLAVMLLLLVTLIAPAARAQSPAGFQWSAGPTVPLLVYDQGSADPLSIAPGAGLQVSLTHSILQRELGGRSWDLLDATLMLFGTRVSPAGGPEFGELSAAAGVCTLSSLVCLVGGYHLLGPTGAVKPVPFAGLALSFNVAFGPPPAPAPTIRSALPVPAPPPRGNTLYLGAVSVAGPVHIDPDDPILNNPASPSVATR